VFIAFDLITAHSVQCGCFRLAVVAVDEHAARSPLRTLEDRGGNDEADESKRSMGLLRLGRSRWSPSESSKRSMGLLRLGRSDAEMSTTHEDDKRSMQLLRLGRRTIDNDVDSDGLGDQMTHRSVIINQSVNQSNHPSIHPS